MKRHYLKQIYSKEKDSRWDIYARMGHFKSSGEIGVLPEAVYVLPCLEISFNDSKRYLKIAWIVFSLEIRYVKFAKIYGK